MNGIAARSHILAASMKALVPDLAMVPAKLETFQTPAVFWIQESWKKHILDVSAYAFLEKLN